MPTVSENFERHIATQRAKLVSAVDEICRSLADFAKAEHSYTDRTGQNTASITGRLTESDADVIRGIFSAGMEYSVFLEKARSGQWAFLMPVILRHRAELTQILAETLGKGGMPSGDAFTFNPNPSVEAEYETYKIDVRNGRARNSAPGAD